MFILVHSAMKVAFILLQLAPTFALASASTKPLEPVGIEFNSQHGLPAFSVRLGPDSQKACNASNSGTAGFIDSDSGNHFFFWAFPSNNDVSKDPVVLWMSGGPGASSVGLGNMMELGPCRILPETLTTTENPYAWNANATVLFVDQPLSVGFSHADSGRLPTSLAETTSQLYEFMQQFFIAFPDLGQRDFYIAGESYGGIWVPTLGAHILKHQASDLAETVKATTGYAPVPLNLRGVSVGNGVIRQSVQMSAILEAGCSRPDSPWNHTRCEFWEPLQRECMDALEVCERDGTRHSWMGLGCETAQTRCMEMIFDVTAGLHRNPYDYRKHCYKDELNCYDEVSAVGSFMDIPSVRDGLGAPGDIPFNVMSWKIPEIMAASGDIWVSSHHDINYLLTEGIRVLIYSGDKDWYGTAAGMRRLVTEAFSWPGGGLYRFQPYEPWMVDARETGLVKHLGPLTYVEVFEAGHMVPYDKPLESLSMFQTWLADGF